MRVSSEAEDDDDVSGEAVDVAKTDVAAGDAVVEDAALELTIIEIESVSYRTESALQLKKQGTEEGSGYITHKLWSR